MKLRDSGSIFGGFALYTALALAAGGAGAGGELAVARARGLFDGPEAAAGELRLAAALVVAEEAAGELPERAEVQALLEPGAFDPGLAVPRFRVSIVLFGIDDETRVFEEEVDAAGLAPSDRWLYKREIEVPVDFLEAVVVIEETSGGAWGAALAELAERPLVGRSPRIVTHPAPSAAPAPPPAPAPVAGGAIRILPPRARPVEGPTRVRALAADLAIERVAFFLDGTQVASDDDPPFAAVLDFGSPPRPQTIRVVGYSDLELVLGEDEVRVNEEGEAFRVKIVRLAGGGPAGPVEVEADVSLPPGGRLERLEIYVNERLVATLEQPPFRARFDHPRVAPGDFVRAVATLADGSSLDDALLLAAAGAQERVEVRLVELYTVVTDRRGAPQRDLGRDDFTVKIDGRKRPIERFGLAEEQPLVLGLVIDTSESMWPLMPDTKQAGSQFLAQVLGEGDRAFLVDFASRPRLARSLTGDLNALLRAFGAMEAEGFTALYDAIVFSLLQFEDEGGRRALVMLSDGDDYRSATTRLKCIQYGRDLGVPVYIIALGGIQNPYRGMRKIDLEGITEGTGGRIFYISEISELDAAYASIEEELRSQYFLAVATDRALTDRELASIRVEVEGRGLQARTVVGGRRVD